MARFTFGGEWDNVAVSEDLTNMGTEATPRAAVAVQRSGALVLSATLGGAPTTDFMLRDAITGEFTTAATSITVGSDGYIPAFQGPDGVRVLYDADGRAVICWEGAEPGGGTALTSYATQVETLSDYPTGFTPTAHEHPVAEISDATTTGRSVLTAASQTAARTAIGAAAAADLATLDTAVDALAATVEATVGSAYAPPLAVGETGGTLVPRSTVTADATQRVMVLLSLGSSIDPYDAAHGYIDGFDIVGRAVPA